MSGRIKITIRDGRIGRDPEHAAQDGLGAVLGVVEQDEALELGDKVKLADGTDVYVIDCSENLGPGNAWEQTVSIGELGDWNRRPSRDSAN